MMPSNKSILVVAVGLLLASVFSAVPAMAAGADDYSSKYPSLGQCKHPVRCTKNPCQSATCAAVPDAICHANYCSDMVHDGVKLAACSAYWSDKKTGKMVNCTKPVDTTPAYVKDLALVEKSCKAPVRCLADPCKNSTCAAHPDAFCYSNYCKKGAVYRGTPLTTPCGSYFVDKKTGDLVNCTKPAKPTKPTSWKKEYNKLQTCVSSIRCARNPCEDPACPINPSAKCFANICNKASYMGTALTPCTPYWFDLKNGDMIQDCKKPAAPSTDDGGDKCFCALIFAPVCCDNGITYANACEAQCKKAKNCIKGSCYEQP